MGIFFSSKNEVEKKPTRFRGKTYFDAINMTTTYASSSQILEVASTN